MVRHLLESVGKNIRDLAKKNEKPRGPRQASNSQNAKDSNGLDYYSQEEEGENEYTLHHYTYLQGSMLTLFEHVRKRILHLDPSVREERKKLYIAYKTTTNFVDVEPHKNHLQLFLNMAFSEIDDPKNLCRDITTIGHHGNGDIGIRLTSLEQLDDTMELIRQAFEVNNYYVLRYPLCKAYA